jgi:4-hydroxy-2-oxoheptanedioate aldolase
MTPRSSRILRELREGKRPTILKMNLSDPRVVELAGLAGASGVWLCNEHVPNDWLNLEHMIRAAKLHDVDTIVRVAKGGYSEYIKPFECDATAIMVPHVSSAEEARKIVEMTRFHPIGRRPMDGGNMDGLFCQIPTQDYVTHSNTERFLVLQIESPEALERVEEIAAVPGFEFLLFGAGDFSHLLGKPGQPKAPEVVAARKRVAEVARRHGKRVITPGMFESRDALEAEGVSVFTLGADVIGLAEYFRAQVSNFHS